MSETSNLYSAFVWLALKLLAGGGELVAITPRSFMNGSYFRPFRQALSRELAFRRIHVYDARDTAFAEDGVLQENVIFHGVRGAGADAIRITTSPGPADDGLLERTVEPDELILPHDPERVLHVVPDEADAKIAANMRSLPHTLAELGVFVSTGRVVGFRAKERLRADAGPGDAPLILPGHCARGFVAWPRASGTKPNALAVAGPDDDLLLPAGWYVLVNRFSAKGRPAPRGRRALRSDAHRRGKRGIRQQAERSASQSPPPARPGERRAFRILGQRARGIPQQHGGRCLLPPVQRPHPGQRRGSSGRCVFHLPAYSIGWAGRWMGSCPRRRRSIAWSGRRCSK